MTLKGKSKIYKHAKAATLYLSIPSQVVSDSTFFLKVGDQVEIENHSNFLTIKKVLASNDTEKTRSDM